MNMTNDNALVALNQLIVIGKDSEQGFQAAADTVKDVELARTFREFATQRTKFINELQQRVRTLRAEPANTGTIAGALHRGWAGLKAALASAETHAILEECERGEDVSVRGYRMALELPDVDQETRRVIQEQYEQVQLAHDRVRDLRDNPAYAHR